MNRSIVKADLDIIQASFVAICTQMHACFAIEEHQQAEYNEILIESNFLSDMQIMLINRILYKISRKNNLDCIIKYEVEKNDECPYEYANVEHTVFWLKNKYNISII